MKVKKPVYKKIWFWVLMVFLFVGVGSALGNDSETPKKEENPVVNKEDDEKKDDEAKDDEKVDEPKEEPKEEVSREFRNALGSAQNYVGIMPFSKEGLFDQLIFEEYPDDAAIYAVDNVKTDWNENALKAALQYLDFSNFSDAGLYDQLIFEKYTPEQAKYAIDNLE